MLPWCRSRVFRPSLFPHRRLSPAPCAPSLASLCLPLSLSGMSQQPAASSGAITHQRRPRRPAPHIISTSHLARSTTLLSYDQDCSAFTHTNFTTYITTYPLHPGKHRSRRSIGRIGIPAYRFSRHQNALAPGLPFVVDLETWHRLDHLRRSETAPDEQKVSPLVVEP